MLEIFQYWQINLALAIILFVVLYQCYRLLAQEVEDTSSVPIIIGFIGSSFFILLIPFFEMKFPTDWRIYMLLLIAGIFYAVNDVLKARGFKYLDVSVVAIFSQFAKIFLIFYGIIVFQEVLTGNDLWGILLILGGVVLVTFKKDSFKVNKYVWLIIGASFAFATSMIIDVGISAQFNLAMYLFIIYFIPAIIIFFVGNKKVEKIKKEFYVSKRIKYLFIGGGLTSALGMMFYLMALRQGQVSIVAPISSATVLLNTLAGYIFLKEKKDPTKRIIAAVLVMIGIFMLT